MHLKDLGNLDSVTKVISNVFGELGQINKSNRGIIIDELKNSLKDYSLESVKAATSQMTLEKAQAKAIFTAKGLTGAELEQAVAAATLSASQKGATTSTIGLSAAFKGLGAKIKVLHKYYCLE